MPKGQGQKGKKRGPYKSERLPIYEKARTLRKQGLGYRTISNEINIPWKTVQYWVSDIKIDTKEAHRNACLLKRKEIKSLNDKNQIKRRLIEERGYGCEHCNLSEWFKEPIVLELHRKISGIPYSQIDDCELLCPNCHSLTDNWKRIGLVE